MAYQVIARKWRPQSFHELVGQEHISTTLLNALRNNRLPQALLFTGVRGTGKTSSARILAKSLRCPNAKDFVPCGVCPTCEDIANSRSLDVIEIDGASNNGVDAVRELRETIGYMPSSGKYKIYIIDEVHMLSTSAFNALLKTLEEPPPHVIFIMATTEAQKIPNTILSRCQRFDFRRIASRQIAAQLEKICLADGVKTESQALWLIARQADGSMRDSQSLLDQVITFCDGEVTLAKVIEVLGLTDRTVLLEALQALVKRDTQKAVDVVESVFRAGYDPKIFAQDLLEELRHCLMIRLCPDDPTRIVDLPDTEISELRKLTDDLSNEDIHLLFDMALKGVSDLLRSQDQRIVLEMLLLRMSAAPRIENLMALLGGTSTPTASPRYPSVAPPATPSPVASIASVAPAVSVAAVAPPAEKPNYTLASFTRPAAGRNPANPLPDQTKPSGPPAESAGATGSGQTNAATRASASGQSASDEPDDAKSDSLAKNNDPWFRFVDRVKKSNSLLGAMLENTHLISSDNQGVSSGQTGSLKIGVPKKMSFLFDKVNDPENLRRIETFIETFWNKKYSVSVVLADAQAGAPVTPKAVSEQAKVAQKQMVADAVEQDPLVKTAQNVFKTQIKSIKELSKENSSDENASDASDAKTGSKSDVKNSATGEDSKNRVH